MEEQKLIDIKQLIKSKNPVLLKFLPGFVIRYLKKVLHQDEINEFLTKHKDKKNEDFASAVINDFNIKVKVKGLENIPKEGGLTIVMNHPLGGMDAMALIHALRPVRTDLKFIVNDLLLNLKGMTGMFVGVNKFARNTGKTFTDVDKLFASDNVICIFPAGLVSRKKKGLIRDLDWKKTFVTQSRKYNHPVVPVYIDGKLSNFFYRLSNFRTSLGIKANIEMLYLADELYKQKNVEMNLVIGKPIEAASMDRSKSDKAWAAQIKNNVYDLEK